MKPTNIKSLVAMAVVMGLLGVVGTLSFYGDFPPISVLNSVVLWVMAAVCAVAGWIISRRIENEEVGLDSSQMNPLSISNWMLVGKATAWIGAAFGGLYVGIGIYVLPKATDLVAANNDVAGVIAGALGGAAAAVAGAYLERSCIAPPPDAPYGLNSAGAKSI